MNNNASWLNVWQKKGKCDYNILYKYSGWEHLTENEYKIFLQNSFDPIKNKILNCEKILEIGCGAGASLDYISKINPKIQLNGFDYSETLIEVCKKNLSGNFFVADINEEDWKLSQECNFDIIYSYGVFLYLKNYETSYKAIKRSLNMLKENGILFITDISDLEKKEMALKMREKTHSSKKIFSKEDLEHLYFSKDFFKKIAEENNLRITFFEHEDICNFDWNISAKYRYNVLMEK